MKKIYWLFVLLISSLNHAQTKSDFKTEFISFIKSQDEFGSILYYGNKNEDYHSKDTLVLSNNTSFFNDFKAFITWSFLSKKTLGISSMHYVEGTHGMIAAKVLEEKNIYQYKIKKIKNESFLIFYQNRKLVEKFKIIDFEYKPFFFKMVLVRNRD